MNSQTPTLCCRLSMVAIRLFVGVAWIWAWDCPSTAVAATGPPNIIIVMPDDIGYGDFACLGNPIIHTPSIDALSRESVRFTDFHVSPTCAPTRAALMTGRHEFKNGVTHTIDERERLTLQATTVAQVLKSAGYTTGIFGKWHLGDEPDRWPSKRGFDEMFIHGAGGIGQTYPGSCGDAPGNTYFDPTILHNGKFERTKGYCTDVFFRPGRVMDRLGKREATVLRLHHAQRGPCAARCARRVLSIATKEKFPIDVAKFYGMIENIDDNVGGLLAKLKDWGLSRQHARHLHDRQRRHDRHSRFQRRDARFEEFALPGRHARAVVLALACGFQGGVDCNALTAHIDIFPTLAEISGAKLTDDVKRQVEGRSLLPLLKNPERRVGRSDSGHASRPLAKRGRQRIQSMPAVRFATGGTRW